MDPGGSIFKTRWQESCMLKNLRTLNPLLALVLVLIPLQFTGRPMPRQAALLKQTVVQPGYVYDDFKKVDIQLPGGDGNNGNGNNPYWWVINNGDGAQVYAGCADASCILAGHEQSTKFARLQLLHDTTPAVWDGTEYNGTEISEYRTMYSSALPGRWLPSYGLPVTVSASVRFSANYLQSGSGGALGTAGMWLWNSYPDPVAYAPINAFGFNWVEQGAAGGLNGLQASALQDTVPVYSQAITTSQNMSVWHTWMFTWRADPSGNQSIQWWLDGTSLGQTALAVPFPALSLTFWNDNQFPTYLQDGQSTVVMHNPTAEQDFDIDWVEIDQPQ